MGVFSTKNMLQENFTSQPVLPLQNSNESFYSMSLEYCKLINEEYDQANKILYKSLLEAGDNYTVINESFDGFFGKIKEIIAKFIKFLKNLIDKFVLKLNQLVKSDKYIKNHEKQFSKFGTDNEFDMQLFNFTFLDDSTIPRANAYTSFTDEFAKITGFLTNGVNNDDSTIIGKENDKQLAILRNAYKDMTDSEETLLDTMRGEIIGERPIDSGDYSSELYRKFRDNDDSTTLTTVTSSMVNMALLRFKAHDKSVKAVKDIQKKLEKDYSDISKHIEKCVSNKGEVLTLIGWGATDVDGGKLSPEVVSELNLISKAISNKVSQMSSIHIQATGAKLDAIKDAFKQDKTLLYKALNELQKWKNVKTESTDEVIPTPVMHVSSLLEMVNSYENYRNIEIHNQNIMNDYFVECMALETHNTQVMEILTESAFDKIKDFVAKVVSKIKEFFGKIVESISHAIEKDQTYLKQYKDIILNKKVQLGTLNEYYDFKIQEIVQGTPIPEFNYESFKTNNVKTEEDFRNKYFANKFNMKSEQSLVDACKLYFMGEPKDYDSEKVNMTNLYNFCWDFKSTKTALDKELNKLSTAQGKAIETADKVAKNAGQQNNDQQSSTTTSSEEKPVDGSKPEEKKGSEQQEKKNDLPPVQKGNLTDEQKKEANASFVYSSVYGGYISESVILEIGNTTDDKKSASTSTNNAAPSSSTQASKNLNLKTGTASKDLSKSFEGETPEEVSKIITAYFNVCNAVLTAKLNVVQKIYNDYMWIIRQHVRSYAGDKDRDNKDHAAKVATVTYTALSDEDRNKLNAEDIANYDKYKEIFTSHFKTINGKLWYSAQGNLNKTGSEKTGKEIDTSNPEAMVKAYEAFLNGDGKEMKAFSDTCKEKYDFTLIPDLDTLKASYGQPVENKEENQEEQK